MTGYGTIDLGAFFATEVRRLDGDDCLFIPLRFNPSIQPYGGHPRIMFTLRPLYKPDENGNTHEIIPHIPKAMAQALPDADYVKMTQPIGRIKLTGAENKPVDEPQSPRGYDYTILAHNPVTDDQIPL